MSNLRRFLAVVLAVIMVVSMATTTAASRFVDIPDEISLGLDAEFLEEAIRVLTDLGVIAGFRDVDTGEETFRPGDTVNRAQMAMFMARLHSGSPEWFTTAPTADDLANNFFVDIFVDPDYPELGFPWALTAINYAVERGIVTGVGSNRFDPAAPVTLAQAATMAVRTLGYLAPSTLEGLAFADRDLNLLRNGLEYVGHGDALTRDQVVVLLYNVLLDNIVTFENVWDPATGVFRRTPIDTPVLQRFGITRIEGYVLSVDDRSEMDPATTVDRRHHSRGGYDANLQVVDLNEQIHYLTRGRTVVSIAGFSREELKRSRGTVEVTADIGTILRNPDDRTYNMILGFVVPTRANVGHNISNQQQNTGNFADRYLFLNAADVPGLITDAADLNNILGLKIEMYVETRVFDALRSSTGTFAQDRAMHYTGANRAVPSARVLGVISNVTDTVSVSTTLEHNNAQSNSRITSGSLTAAIFVDGEEFGRLTPGIVPSGSDGRIPGTITIETGPPTTTTDPAAVAAHAQARGNYALIAQISANTHAHNIADAARNLFLANNQAPAANVGTVFVNNLIGNNTIGTVNHTLRDAVRTAIGSGSTYVLPDYLQAAIIAYFADPFNIGISYHNLPESGGSPDRATARANLPAYLRRAEAEFVLADTITKAKAALATIETWFAPTGPVITEYVNRLAVAAEPGSTEDAIARQAAWKVLNQAGAISYAAGLLEIYTDMIEAAITAAENVFDNANYRVANSIPNLPGAQQRTIAHAIEFARQSGLAGNTFRNLVILEWLEGGSHIAGKTNAMFDTTDDAALVGIRVEAARSGIDNGGSDAADANRYASFLRFTGNSSIVWLAIPR